MEGGIVIEPMSQGDLDELLDLLGGIDEGINADYLLWKYEQTPPNQLSVARNLDTSKVVGFNALIQWPVIFETTDYDAVQSVDTIVHPQYRGRGIWYRICTELYRTARENGVILIIGWTARYGPAWKGLVEKLGWTDIGRIQMFAYPIKPFKAVKWLEWGRLKSLIAGLFLWIRKCIKHPRRIKSDGLVIEKGTWDYEGLWRCWNESLAPGTAAIRKSPDFYRRRFSRSKWPPDEFVPIVIREKERIVCFAICLTQNLDKGTGGVIADLHSIVGNETALRVLIAECIRHFEAEGADFVRGWAKKPNWILRELVDSGFVIRNIRQCFLLLSLSDDVPIDSRLFDFNIWDLDLCDSDHI
jgi:GNAT superfamily N-acetyltransferase